MTHLTYTIAGDARGWRCACTCGLVSGIKATRAQCEDYGDIHRHIARDGNRKHARTGRRTFPDLRERHIGRCESCGAWTWGGACHTTNCWAAMAQVRMPA